MADAGTITNDMAAMDTTIAAMKAIRLTMRQDLINEVAAFNAGKPYTVISPIVQTYINDYDTLTDLTVALYAQYLQLKADIASLTAPSAIEIDFTPAALAAINQTPNLVFATAYLMYMNVLETYAPDATTARSINDSFHQDIDASITAVFTVPQPDIAADTPDMAMNAFATLIQSIADAEPPPVQVPAPDPAVGSAGAIGATTSP